MLWKAHASKSKNCELDHTSIILQNNEFYTTVMHSLSDTELLLTESLQLVLDSKL